MHIYQPPPAPRQIEPSIPIAVEMLILSTLAKDPAQRPTMAEVTQQLEMLGAKTTGMMPIVRAPGNQSYPNITPVPNELSSPNQTSGPSLAGVGQTSDATRLHMGQRLKRLAIPAAMATVLSAIGIVIVMRTSSLTSNDDGRPRLVKNAVQAPKKKITWKIDSKPSGVEVVRVSDGRVLGMTPFKLEQDALPGKTGLTLRRGGFYDQQVLMDGEQDGTESVTLDPLPGTNPNPGVNPPTPPGPPSKGGKKLKKSKQPEAPKDDVELAPVR